MEGMRFLIINEVGPVNHGIINQRLTPDRYLVTFARVPQSSRVAALDEIMGWNLFPNDETMNAFIADNQATPAVPKADPDANPKTPRPPSKSVAKRIRAQKANKKKGVNRGSK